MQKQIPADPSEPTTTPDQDLEKTLDYTNRDGETSSYYFPEDSDEWDGLDMDIALGLANPADFD